VYWRRRGSPEMIVISFEKELNKECVLEEERGATGDVQQL
jgi:hypothetical protein